MQGLAKGQVGLTSRLENHLDGCLACRSCEAVCPAEVPYGRLIDAGRAELARQRPARLRRIRLMGSLLSRAWLRRAVAYALWAYQASRLQALIRRLRLLGRGKLARLESLLPPLERPQRRQAAYTTTLTPSHGSIALFVGCVSDLAEQALLRDSIRLLLRLGYDVQVPSGQTCCGALHLHNGMPEHARRLAAQNCQAFAGDCDAIVGTASGCTATLKEYQELLPPSICQPMTLKVQDICVFLDQAKGWERLHFRPLAETVAIQEPCTLRNVLKGNAAAYRLLARIPGLEVTALAGNNKCCGAAGSYFLTEPDAADQLVADKLADIDRSAPYAVVTSNVGCALHLGGALRRAGKTVAVRHPVSLLVQQLEDRSAAD
jgi:glycolate oxidase iron-sulfur subunit